jgi:glyoxylase-like metal-dependent hydrolase (beta-lactamase superfamily II)
MKTLWTLLIAVNTLFAFEYGLKPKKLGEGIYCFFGAPEAMNEINNGNMVNSCFVDMVEGWLVVDSGPTYRYAQEATSLMQQVKKMPVTHVINTHVHDDHWLGNNYYIEQGATVLGSEAFKYETHVTPTRMQSRISAEAYEQTVPVFPLHYVQEEHVFTTPNGDIILRVLSDKAHTHGDLYVYLPSHKALFAGDLVFNDRLPSLRHGDINGWIEALEHIMAMDLDVIVGGHGYRTDNRSPEFTLNYLKELKHGIKAIIDEGGEIDEAVETLTMDVYKATGMYDTMHKPNVNTAFRMLEWDDE